MPQNVDNGADVEKVRAALNRAADRSSARALARAIKVTHTTLNSFLSGETGKPSGVNWKRMVDYVDRLPAPPVLTAGVPEAPTPYRLLDAALTQLTGAASLIRSVRDELSGSTGAGLDRTARAVESTGQVTGARRGSGRGPARPPAPPTE